MTIVFLLLCFIVFVFSNTEDPYKTPQEIQNYQETHYPCPGYCGRGFDKNTHEIQSDKCQGCAWGSQSDGYVCLPCNSDLTPSSIIYLIFSILIVVITILGVSNYFISNDFSKDSFPLSGRDKFFFQTSGLIVLEHVLTLCITIVILPPVGSFSLIQCDVDKIDDFYTGFHNPPGYHCLSEKSFPLFSFLLIYLGICALFTVLFRIPWAIKHKYGAASLNALYSALWFYPSWATFHIIFGGLLYFGYPWIFLILLIYQMTYVFLDSKDSIILYLKNPEVLIILVFTLVILGLSFAGVCAQFTEDTTLILLSGFIGPFIFPVLLLLLYPLSDPKIHMNSVQ